MVEAIKTEKYDYSKEVRKAERVHMELDKLSTGQLLKVHDFIEQIKEDPADDELHVRDWFNQAILPMLKNFAESQGAVLEITEEGGSAFTAQISDINSIDVEEHSGILKSLFLLASYTTVEAVDDKLRVFLTYEWKGFES